MKPTTGRIAFNIDEETRNRLVEYTTKRGFGLRGQGEAIIQLLKVGLDTEGF